jgi:predicted DCC family thiol-disulfide oxidoreductase YuxK
MADPRPYSYRTDPGVPDFNDRKPLFVFDGVCVLCSTGASWLMRYDGGGRVNFTSAQGTLGRALYAHWGMNIDESYLLVDGGRVYTASDGYLRLCRILGGPWHLLRIGAIIPRPIRDRAYGLIARNRYRWFGKADYCDLLTREQQKRLLQSE